MTRRVLEGARITSFRLTAEERNYLDHVAERERISKSAALSLILAEHRAITAWEITPQEAAVLTSLRQNWEPR